MGRKWRLVAGVFASVLFLVLGVGCAPDGKPFAAVQEIPAGKGIVYVYNPDRFKVPCEILINDSAVGCLHGHEYLAFRCQPGPVTVSTGWQTELRSVTLNVLPGQAYYVHVDVDSHVQLFAYHQQEITPSLEKAQDIMDDLKECRLSTHELGLGLASERWGRVDAPKELAAVKTIYVDAGEKGWESPKALIELLKARGYNATMGPMADMPPSTQCLVRVKEYWFWDMGTYLLDLQVEFVNPQSKAVIAAAKVHRAQPQGRRGGKVMATEAFNSISNQGWPLGVELVQ